MYAYECQPGHTPVLQFQETQIHKTLKKLEFRKFCLLSNNVEKVCQATDDNTAHAGYLRLQTHPHYIYLFISVDPYRINNPYGYGK